MHSNLFTSRLANKIVLLFQNKTTQDHFKHALFIQLRANILNTEILSY